MDMELRLVSAATFLDDDASRDYVTTTYDNFTPKSLVTTASLLRDSAYMNKSAI